MANPPPPPPVMTSFMNSPLRKTWIDTTFKEWPVMRELLGHEVLNEVQQEWEQWDVNAANEMSNVL